MSFGVRGYVERIDPELVVGWAYDFKSPNQPVEVQVRQDNRILADTIADLTRDDLLEQGIGSGRHGFSMTISDDLWNLLHRGEAEIWVSDARSESWYRIAELREQNDKVGLSGRVLRALSGRRRFAQTTQLQAEAHIDRDNSVLSLATHETGNNLGTGLRLQAYGANSAGLLSGVVDNLVKPKTGFSPNSIRFEVKGKLFGTIDRISATSFEGWMLANHPSTTPFLLIDGVPAAQTEWPLIRGDVTDRYGVQRKAGFRFEFDASPGSKVDLLAFDGHRLFDVAHTRLPLEGQSKGAERIWQIIEDAAKPDAVAITCWDGAHNPIGRAKVLYDVLDGRRPVWLFCYLFDEFGGRIWAPLAGSNLRIMTIPWKQREQYHRMFEVYGIRFPTVWMCKPRLPTLLLASAIAAPDARLVLDFDDNEEHFSKSPGSAEKAYGGETIGLVRSLIEEIDARTAASKALAEDYKTEIVRHARQTSDRRRFNNGKAADRPLRIGFVGTVRPHKRLLEASQAIAVASHIFGCRLELNVYGDIRPDDYRKDLEANNVVTRGNIPAEELQEVLQTFDVVLTGYPSQSDGDEPITRYQISSKIGDALANGIPALVPRTRSVADLDGTPGVFLFDADDFPDVLMKALRYRKKIMLPRAFTLDGAYEGFAKAESEAPRDASALRLFARSSTPGRPLERSVLLIWKQQDSGLYGRRVDQIARAIRHADPDVTVRVVEFMNDSVRDDITSRSASFLADAAQLLALADQKVSGNFVTVDGTEYHQLAVKTDRHAPAALTDFLWRHGHSPANTLIVTFPAFPLLTQLAGVIAPFPMVADIVDNQLAWGNNRTRSNLIGQYAWLMKSSRQVVFNSADNMAYFRDAGFLNETAKERVSIVPNWYMAQAHRNLMRREQPPVRNGIVDVIYSGNLNDRIDWALLERLARSSDKLRLHIAGDGSRMADRIRAMMLMDNFVYYGPLSEDRLSNLLARMHFAIMPHVTDDVSSFMNPLKVLMYSAHGLNTVAMAVPGLNEIDGLSVADDPTAFLTEVHRMATQAREGTLNIPGETAEGMPDFARTYVDLVLNEVPTLSASAIEGQGAE